MKHVHEIAKDRGITSKEALEVLRRAGLDVKAAASKVEEADAARAFGSGLLRRPVPPHAPRAAKTAKADPTARAENEGAKPRQRMKLKDFIAWVEAEQPKQLSVAEVARVWPPPWFTRSGSGTRARIRLPLGEQKYERRQGQEHWQRVEDWTMGPPR